MRKTITGLVLAALVWALAAACALGDITYVEVKKGASIRAEASYNAEKIRVAKVGERFEYIEGEGLWYKIRYEGYGVGYLPKESCKLVTAPGEPTSVLIQPAGRSADIRVAVGDTVSFGNYPQTAEGGDSTPIEWTVLGVDPGNHRVLLISRRALDSRPYNTEFADATWETSALRRWLNGDFFAAAFSAQEQAAVLTTFVDNGANQGYEGFDTKGQNKTQDKVFLLSYREAWQYFPGDAGRRCAPTDYAAGKGVYADAANQADGRNACLWWLRSPGNYLFCAITVGGNGALLEQNNTAYFVGVRPAVWVSADALN